MANAEILDLTSGTPVLADSLEFQVAAGGAGSSKRTTVSALTSLAPAAGLNTEFQFNAAGVRAGAPGLTYNSSTDIVTASTGLVLGVASVFAATLTFLNATNAFATSFKAGVAAASVTYTLPTNVAAAAGYVLTDAAGDGVLSWAAGGGGATLGANTFTAMQTITQASANAGILASTGYSLTGSNATTMVSLAGTWNTSGVATILNIAVTNTASGTGSKFISCKAGAAGATELFSVDKRGVVEWGNTTQIVGALTYINSADAFVWAKTGNIYLSSGAGATTIAVLFDTTLEFQIPGRLRFTTNNDVSLQRNAAGVVEVNSGTFNTYRDLKLRTLINSGSANTAYWTGTGYSLTGSDATGMVDLAGTWNTSGNPVALKIAMTNTASGATSKFLSFLAGAAGATELFFIGKDGNPTVSAGGDATVLTLNGGGSNNYAGISSNGRLYLNGASRTIIETASVVYMGFSASKVFVKDTFPIAWAGDADAGTSVDVGIARNAAGVVEANSGTVGTLRDFKARDIIINGATNLLKTSAALTDNAGAGAGTITNAPAAGNPTKWARVDDNGTARFIPMW